jgi:hypothetical protein
MQTESKWIRELILSGHSDNIELGLILNDSFKCFPLTRKFYRKHKRFKFWHPPRHYSVLESESRYYSWVALLNNELKTHKAYFWLDFKEPKYKTPWEHWQLHITNHFNWPYKGIMFTGGGHPYTAMFIRGHNL